MFDCQMCGAKMEWSNLHDYNGINFCPSCFSFLMKRLKDQRAAESIDSKIEVDRNENSKKTKKKMKK